MASQAGSQLRKNGYNQCCLLKRGLEGGSLRAAVWARNCGAPTAVEELNIRFGRNEMQQPRWNRQESYRGVHSGYGLRQEWFPGFARF